MYFHDPSYMNIFLRDMLEMLPEAHRHDRLARPMNKFMLFRTTLNRWYSPDDEKKLTVSRLALDLPCTRGQNTFLSPLSSKIWALLSEAQQAPYHEVAKQRAMEFKLRHPDFRYNLTAEERRVKRAQKGRRVKSARTGKACRQSSTSSTSCERPSSSSSPRSVVSSDVSSRSSTATPSSPVSRGHVTNTSRLNSAMSPSPTSYTARVSEDVPPTSTNGRWHVQLPQIYDQEQQVVIQVEPLPVPDTRVSPSTDAPIQPVPLLAADPVWGEEFQQAFALVHVECPPAADTVAATIQSPQLVPSIDTYATDISALLYYDGTLASSSDFTSHDTQQPNATIASPVYETDSMSQDMFDQFMNISAMA
ncbi:hypothetical protein FISHEDRAFT_60738 [Fistulina hepatica ATCC 64428]|uniref:HMG box domain-containing protein n=1 Tax=Fistulina hepatica ATCC 64428 TaxID=1128425 RepID=A0A0D7A693_9AGAR|nr:hypothetical protein FISHEDRAFT_60738 [Fistulina hepatica ATCC 64428]